MGANHPSRKIARRNRHVSACTTHAVTRCSTPARPSRRASSRAAPRRHRTVVLKRAGNYPGIDLTGVDLHRAHLEEVNLKNARLVGANLWGAHLSGANLEGADLMDAVLTGADLEGAILTGANLKGARIDPTTLSKARGIEGVV